MNRTKIISNAELKLILGNSNLSDALASIHNQLSINMLCDILQTNNLSSHSVSKEEIEVLGDGSALEFRDFPVDSSTIELYNTLNSRIDTDISYRADSHSDQIIHLVDSSGVKNIIGYLTGQVLANYTGGFQNSDVLTLQGNASDGNTLVIDQAGVQTTYTMKEETDDPDSQILIGLSETITTQKIASKIGGSSEDNVWTAPVGTSIVSTSIEASIDSADMPEDLKFVCALIAGGSIGHAERANGVVSYKLGQKSVNFRNQGEAEAAQKILDMYLSRYNPISIFS
jgi:hypothetical protein